MVPLSTSGCGHKVYVSAPTFKHCSCCVQTPLVGFLGLWPHHVYNFPDVRCRPWLLLSDGFYIPIPRSREGGGLRSIRSVPMGSEWPKIGGLALCHTQRSPTCSDPCLSLPVPGRNRNAQHSLHQQLDSWYCHGHIHVVISIPRWSHTWRYAPSPCRTLPWMHVLAVQMVNV